MGRILREWHIKRFLTPQETEPQISLTANRFIAPYKKNHSHALFSSSSCSTVNDLVRTPLKKKPARNPLVLRQVHVHMASCCGLRWFCMKFQTPTNFVPNILVLLFESFSEYIPTSLLELISYNLYKYMSHTLL